MKSPLLRPGPDLCPPRVLTVAFSTTISPSFHSCPWALTPPRLVHIKGPSSPLFPIAMSKAAFTALELF